MAHKHIDFVYFGPKSYVEASTRANAQALAIEVDKSGAQGYYGVIITRKGSGIENLDQAVGNGHTFAFTDPKTGEPSYVFTLGYGLILGQNDRKAIAMSILDRALCAERPESPVEDQEFVLSHIDNMESQGFIAYLKLPHYVSFQPALDRIRSIRQKMRHHAAQNLEEVVHV